MSILFGKKLGKYQFLLKPHNNEEIIPNTDKENNIAAEANIRFFKKNILNERIFIKKMKNNLCSTIFSKIIQNNNKIIIINNCIKAKLDAIKNESISED